MATPKWAPSTLYAPGAIVVPRSNVPTASTSLSNGGFESGATDWSTGNGSVSSIYPYTGTNSLRFTGDTGLTEAVHSPYPVSPGRQITARCQYDQGGAGAGQNPGTIFLRWYTSTMVPIGSDSKGNTVDDTTGGGWKQSVVTASAPAGAAFVAVGIEVNKTHSDSSNVDDFAWDYYTASAPVGLVYRATQSDIGSSAAEEPEWPPAVGVPVVDNEVTWEGVLASRVIWEAKALMKSGATEPNWPSALDESIPDNTVKWVLSSRRVTDPKAPKSKYVVIDSGKVYAGDKDIVAFSATNNPMDWHSEKDAGYIPFGLGKYGSNPLRVLGLYRGNLLPFNTQGFQLWQIDPDPALNNKLDDLPVGSAYHHAFAPVSNDAFYLSALGVRTVGVSATGTNIKAGDVGMPIDPLVQAKLLIANAMGVDPIGLYIPSAGQYWLVFNDTDGPEPGSCEVFVYTMSQVGQIGAWSRYLFPHRIDAHAIDGDMLLLRAGEMILEYSEHALMDLEEDGTGVDITSVLWWPYLEMGGQIGQDKSLEAVDLVSIHTGPWPTIEFGWNQKDFSQFTPPHPVPPDTTPEAPMPFELTAPSISVRLTYTGGGFQFSALNLYLQHWTTGK